MPGYVDGFVLVVPTKNLDAYKRIAQKAARVWKDHGALEYRECVGEDLAVKFGLPFPRLVKAKRNETVNDCSPHRLTQIEISMRSSRRAGCRYSQ